jgi:zinc and cadmium transporter
MTVLFFCATIVVASLVGGLLPLSRRVSHLTLQVYLGLSAGAMLGAACFHMLPEGAELAGSRFGFWTLLGITGLYFIERFLSPHSHETPEDAALAAGPDAAHARAHTCGHAHEHHHTHAHAAQPAAGHTDTERTAAAPPVAGWSALAGLSIHTLLGGVALGSAALGQAGPKELGLAVFLATILHKPADALTISTLLIKAGTERRRVLAVQLGFALLIPLGVLLFVVGRAALTSQLDSAFTGCVIAFSAGTFISIALSDMLPEVQFHSHDRVKLFLAFLAGAALMWATALFEPGHDHDHDHAEPEPAAQRSPTTP